MTEVLVFKYTGSICVGVKKAKTLSVQPSSEVIDFVLTGCLKVCLPKCKYCLNRRELEEEELLDAVTFPFVDDIPEPIKVLDDIISEFEDTSCRPLIQNNGENQSEDDGYMSLSRKNMKEKRDSEELSQSSSNCVSVVTPNESFDFVKRNVNDCCKTTEQLLLKPTNDRSPNLHNLAQTTLPKARSVATGSNYSSLPCCGQRTTSAVAVCDLKNRVGGSCNSERNALGIDISAVHKAVLRGTVAKLPEPMLNEHPVTIYPGPWSPSKEDIGRGGRSSRPKHFIRSVEKHKEMCHILNPLSTSNISSSSTSSSPTSTETCSDNRKTQGTLSSQHQSWEKSLRNTSDDEELSGDSSLEGITVSSESTQHTPSGIAWEIQFKDFKKKTKQLGPTSDKLHDTACNSSFIQPAEEEFRNFKRNAEKRSSCFYRNASMVGKGTFIIRRGTNKKVPAAMDIFSNYPAPSRGDYKNKTSLNESQSKSIKYLPEMQYLDRYKSEDANMHQQKEEEEMNEAQGITSPRDRLSLDLEPQHHQQNVSRWDLSPRLQVTDGELAKAIKKCNLVSPECRLSTDLITNIKTVNDKESTASSNFDFILSANASPDTPNVYMYKATTNGVEYNELRCSNSTTPHTDLAPTLEEDEEQLSDISFGCAPLKQIENNISALLRGEMAVVRMSDIIAHQPQKNIALKRPLEFRPGVHKSESAKEMLLSQNALGPLPPSPPSSNPENFDYGDLPLPPSPEAQVSSDDDEIKKPMQSYLRTTAAEVHTQSVSREELPPQRIKEIEKPKVMHRHMSDELPLPPPPTATNIENLPPVVPPHRSSHSTNTMKSWSIDSNYKRKSPRIMCYGSGVTTPTSSHGPSYDGISYGGGYGTRRYVSYGTKRSLKQSPREEHRLQTSCSLPETPIFARGCDIPRTPYRRTPNETTPIGTRTAPRSSTSNNINMGNSIVGISAGNTYGGGSMCRQRSINQALASNEMLRLSGAPQRGWYPKQRAMRPASTENIDRLHSIRVWDSNTAISGTGSSRKPLTLPPNLTPSFLNQSPREALRRVTSLLITKKKSSKEKRNKSSYSADHALDVNNSHYQDIDNGTTQKVDSKRSQSIQSEKSKKKGIFKTLWKRTKHFSLDQ